MLMSVRMKIHKCNECIVISLLYVLCCVLVALLDCCGSKSSLLDHFWDKLTVLNFIKIDE